MTSNELTYIGLAHRAGKTVFGSAACEKAIKRKKARLLLLQSEMSRGSKETFRRLCEYHHVDVREVESKIGEAIGKPGVMVVAIIETGFAETIKNKVDSAKGSGKE